MCCQRHRAGISPQVEPRTLVCLCPRVWLACGSAFPYAVVVSCPVSLSVCSCIESCRSAPVSASPTILFTLMEERQGLVDADDDDESSVPLGGSRATTKSRGISLISEFETMRVGSMGAASTASGEHGPGSGGHRHPHRQRAPSDGSEDDSESDTSSDEDEIDLPFQLDP
jgi:hypothetical protein